MADCYARSTNCCSNKLSKEHYISKCLLELSANHDGFVEVDGLPAHGPIPLSPKNTAVARVLCEHHNNALSEFDTAICKLVNDLMSFNSERRDMQIVASGRDITLWLIKTMLGRLAAQKSQSELFGGDIRFEGLVATLFSDSELADQLGVELRYENPPSTTLRERGFSPWVVSYIRADRLVVGYKAWFYPFSFTFLLPTGASRDIRPMGCKLKLTDEPVTELDFRISW